MGKQPVGVPMMNFNERMDTMLHVLNYPQKPVTFTKISELTGMDDMGSGAEAIVLIASLEGYNVVRHMLYVYVFKGRCDLY